MEKIRKSKFATNRDLQRADFIDSLYKTMKTQAKEVVAERDRFIALASSYVEDDLNNDECIELLVLDGLTREAAEGYVNIALASKASLEEGIEGTEEGSKEYCFQFEDQQGRVWSSFDVNMTILASSCDRAWDKSEDLLSNEYPENSYKIISVDEVS